MSKDGLLKRAGDASHPWLSVKAILRLGRSCNDTVGAMCKPNPPHGEGPEAKPFTNSTRSKMVRWAPIHLKSSVLLFLVPDLR